LWSPELHELAKLQATDYSFAWNVVRVQNKFGVQQSECNRLTGLPISHNSNCRQEYVDKFGQNICVASRIPHSEGRYGTPHTCEHIFTNDLMLSDKSSDEATKLRQGIRSLADDETIIDVKTLGPGQSYNIKFPQKAREAKQTRVVQSYLRTTARKLDISTTQATPSSIGAVEKHLRSCRSGGVLPFVVGAFGGVSPCLSAVAYELAKAQAADYSHVWKQDSSRTDQAQYAPRMGV
jgi:hypothetical protein